jgi:hypothetical protein
MHYPTHSTSGPISAMGAHATRVCCFGFANRDGDPYFAENLYAFSAETALFEMSNGATMRICEHRESGLPGRETFRLYGTDGAYESFIWYQRGEGRALELDEMRDRLPDEVAEAFREITGSDGYYGGHGGSHAFLVHEFVDAIAHNRQPDINVWQAVRYMVAGVMAHQSALRDGELLDVPDWGDAPAG